MVPKATTPIKHSSSVAFKTEMFCHCSCDENIAAKLGQSDPEFKSEHVYT